MLIPNNQSRREWVDVFTVNKVHQKTMGLFSGDPRDREEANKTQPAWKPIAVSAEHQDIGTGTFMRLGSCYCFVLEQLLNHIINVRKVAYFPVLHFQTCR